MAIDTSQLQSVIQEAAQEFGLVGAQFAMRIGEESIEIPYGIANFATGQPVTTDTIFQIGSTTKLFTAMLVMQLVDAGAVDIDQPVRTYLPDLVLADNEPTGDLTPRHLMSMTSGIDNGPYLDTGRGDDSVQRYVDLLKSIPMIARPGASFGYTNASTNVSGLMVERLTGLTWDTAVASRILEPAGLQHAATLPEFQIYHPVAVGHRVKDGKIRHSYPWIITRGAGPAGTSLSCSAGDLVRFGTIFLRDGVDSAGTSLLTSESVAVMQTQQVEVPSRWFAHGWCVGPYTKTWDGVQMFGHSGTTACGSSTLLWIPERNAAIAVTVNVSNRGYHFADRVFGHVFPEVLGIDKPTRPTRSPGVTVDPAPYVGHYDSYNEHFEMSQDGERLFVTMTIKHPEPGSPVASQVVTSELYPLGDHRFLPADDAIGADHLWDVAFIMRADGSAGQFLNGAFAARRVSD